jgi:hypothetical protein
MTRTMRERVGGFRLMRITILSIALAVVVLAGVSSYAWHRSSQARGEFCDSMHTLVSTLDQMIADGRRSLDAYLHDGTITVEQHHRELRRIEGQRRALGPADCPPR